MLVDHVSTVIGALTWLATLQLEGGCGSGLLSRLFGRKARGAQTEVSDRRALPSAVDIPAVIEVSTTAGRLAKLCDRECVAHQKTSFY